MGLKMKQLDFIVTLGDETFFETNTLLGKT